MDNYKGSTSSIWGSATFHINDNYGNRRLEWDSWSTPESHVSLNIDTTERLTGNPNIVCKTQAEYKANKLNRNEQTKLEHFQNRVVKAKMLKERQFTSSERAFRAKSAKLLNRVQIVESKQRPSSYSNSPTAGSRVLPRRLNSFPVVSKPTDSKLDQEGCGMCAQIQTVIQMFELEGRHEGAKERTTGHSTCLFTDVQVRTFVHMLEAKYFEDFPILNEKLRKAGGVSHLAKTESVHKMSLEEINQSIANKDVELRIAKFCKSLDKFNKDHVSIPSDVRDAVERVRLANAIVKLQKIPPRHVQIKQEVEQMFDLS